MPSYLWEIISYQTIPIYSFYFLKYFEIISNLQESYKNSTEYSCICFTQIPRFLPAFLEVDLHPVKSTSVLDARPLPESPPEPSVIHHPRPRNHWPGFCLYGVACFWRFTHVVAYATHPFLLLSIIPSFCLHILFITGVLHLPHWLAILICLPRVYMFGPFGEGCLHYASLTPILTPSIYWEQEYSLK